MAARLQLPERHWSAVFGLWQGSSSMTATYRGKPLKDYTKEELIKIVIEMGKMQEQSHRQHIHDLEFLSNLGSKV